MAVDRTITLTAPHRMNPYLNSSQSRAEFLLRQPEPSGIRRGCNVQRAIDCGSMSSQRGSLVRLNVEKQVNFRTHRQSPLGRQLKILTSQNGRRLGRAKASGADRGHRRRRAPNGLKCITATIARLTASQAPNAERRILITNSWDENAGEVFGFHPSLGFAN